MNSQKAILLVRVSTESQDYTAQKNDLIEYSKKLGISEYHIIEDKESAIKLSEEERNGLNDMKLWFTENPDYNTVIVWEISRLARSEKVLHSIKDYFLQNHIQLYIYDKQYRLLNDDGSENQETGLLFSLYAYFAASEMKLKKERFKRSKDLNAKRGKFNGGNIRFGYKLDDQKYVVPDETNAGVVKKMYLMYATGKYTVRTLKNELEMHNIRMSLDQVLSILSYRGYTGKGKRFHYPQIIDESLFEKVEKIRKSNNNCATKTTRYYFGGKILRCTECGHGLIVVDDTYTCVYSQQKRHTIQCSTKTSIKREFFDVLAWYVALQKHREYILSDKENKIDEIFNDIKQLMLRTVVVQNQINQIKKKYERINKLYVDMKIDDNQYKTMSESIDVEVKKKETILSEYDSEVSNKQILLTQMSENKKIELSEDLTLKEMKDIVALHVEEAHIYKITDRRYKCTRVEFKLKDGTRDEFIVYSYNKLKFEHNGIMIDDQIRTILGKTLQTIKDDL